MTVPRQNQVDTVFAYSVEMFYFLFLGVIQGIIGTVSVCAGFISPIIVGFITYHQVSVFIFNALLLFTYTLNTSFVLVVLLIYFKTKACQLLMQTNFPVAGKYL